MLAVASRFLNRPVEPRTLVAGEVGLAGEVHAIGQAEARVREAAKLGFKRCIFPESSRRQLPPVDGVDLRGVQLLNEAWDGAPISPTAAVAASRCSPRLRRRRRRSAEAPPVVGHA